MCKAPDEEHLYICEPTGMQPHGDYYPTANEAKLFATREATPPAIALPDSGGKTHTGSTYTAKFTPTLYDTTKK